MACFFCGEERRLSNTEGFRNVCTQCEEDMKADRVQVSYGVNPETGKLGPKLTWADGRERWA